jgi:hypothetical protein
MRIRKTRRHNNITNILSTFSIHIFDTAGPAAGAAAIPAPLLQNGPTAPKQSPS